MSSRRIALALSFLLMHPLAAVRAEEPAAAVESEDAAAEAELELLVNAIQANRAAMVAANLDLTEAEAEAFWPVYARYHTETNSNGDRLAALIKRYTEGFSATTDEQAMSLVEDYLAIDAERVQLRRTYLAEFAHVLPGKKVARLYQIENKLDAVIRYDLAATIPAIPQ